MKVDPGTLSAKMTWPAGKEPSAIPERAAFGSALLEIAAVTLATTCMIQDSFETLRKLMNDDVVGDRLNMIMNHGNSRHRLTGHAVPRLSEWIALSQKSYPLRATRPLIQPRARNTQPKAPRTPVNTIEGKPPAVGVRDHQDTQIRSVIDVHLWDAAGWTGVAYEYRFGWPPFVALMFTNGDAGRQIFQRWRDRFGREDKDEAIHFAILRAIDPDHEHHYRPLITSNWSIDDLEDRKVSLTTGRMLTVPANSSRNLEGALAAYQKVGAFVLVPATMNGDAPTFHHDLGILKRSWVIKNAADVAAHEPESMAVRRRPS